MRDINRIRPLLENIERLWLRNPDLRLGQLLVCLAGEKFEKNPFYIEDDELIIALERNEKLWEKKQDYTCQKCGEKNDV